MREDLSSIGEPARGFGWAAPLLLGVAALFCGLGAWQWQRAGEQERLEARQATRAALAPLAVNGDEAPEDIAGRTVALRGALLAAQTIRIEGRKWGGRTGQHAVVPLRLTDGRSVAVVLGWLPDGAPLSLPEANVAIRGVAAEAWAPPLRLDDHAVWGEVWPWVDLERLRARVGPGLADYLVYADPPWAGLRPAAPLLRSKRGMHEGYAIQWFAFAVVALVGAAGAWRQRL